jgi:hypothetical protein
MRSALIALDLMHLSPAVHWFVSAQANHVYRQMPAWQCCQISKKFNTVRKAQSMRPHRDDSLMASLNMQLEA